MIKIILAFSVLASFSLVHAEVDYNYERHIKKLVEYGMKESDARASVSVISNGVPTTIGVTLRTPALLNIGGINVSVMPGTEISSRLNFDEKPAKYSILEITNPNDGINFKSSSSSAEEQIQGSNCEIVSFVQDRVVEAKDWPSYEVNCQVQHFGKSQHFSATNFAFFEDYPRALFYAALTNGNHALTSIHGAKIIVRGAGKIIAVPKISNEGRRISYLESRIFKFACEAPDNCIVDTLSGAPLIVPFSKTIRFDLDGHEIQ